MKHSEMITGLRHPIHNWEFDNAALREAESIPAYREAGNPLSINLKKLALQLDDNSLWMLVDSVEDTENPGIYLTTWKAVGGVGKGDAYKYMGFRCTAVAVPDSIPTVVDIGFYDGLQQLIPYKFTGATSNYGLLPNIIDGNTDTSWTGADSTLPVVIYGLYDDRIRFFDMYTGVGEVGSFLTFDLVASDDTENWDVIESFSKPYIEGDWKLFHIKGKIESLIYFDDAARLTDPQLSSSDIGLVAKQIVDSTYWLLQEVNPDPIWLPLGGSASAGVSITSYANAAERIYAGYDFTDADINTFVKQEAPLAYYLVTDVLVGGEGSETTFYELGFSVASIQSGGTLAVTEWNIWTSSNGYPFVALNSVDGFTVQSDASLDLPIGSIFKGYNQGSGDFTFTAESGVTINVASGAVCSQFKQVELIKTGANTWLLTVIG